MGSTPNTWNESNAATEAHSLVIEELADQHGPLSIHYQKRGEGLCPSYTTPLLSVFMPRCASNFEVRLPIERHARTLDAYSLAVIPSDTRFQVFGNTAISDAVTFTVSKAIVDSTAALYGIDIGQRFANLRSVAILTRTNWLNEVMHRYVYERTVSKNSDNNATRFLEQEIVKEVYYRLDEQALLDKSRFDLDNLATDLRSPLLRAAMAFVDANLFRDIAVADIARQVGVSESTVLREFQTRLERSPSSYIVERRLEESMILIKSQRYSIGQVSDIVGYENVSAFSAAFKKKFGATPSQVVTKNPKDAMSVKASK